ncbi:MAG: TonB-dependent receptor [Flavisolibacter sp.]|jgi:hypothetical protein|nr:TonB-dependent receptor [Flavisolibacter sp.]
MLKKLLLSGLVLLIAQISLAQFPGITGRITDQNANRLSGATVQLQKLSDSAQVRTVRTDTAGNFSFSAVERDSFRLMASYVGFNEVYRLVAMDTSDIQINIMMVPSSSNELATVVITSSATPVTQRGDTLQISANQFKVNPDASAEDLMRKVPGITIENGQVKAQGENVQKVTIDGRELFGDDATAALRNLPAEIIDKIQIFDRLSDQAQFTGFDDGSATKSINIITKANMRDGQFGRVFAGYGTDQRYHAGGNATLLKNNRRISFVGNFNNINQQNFSQQDLLGATSNVQRGGGGGPRGGGGGPRGGSGNRGPAGAGGNQGVGNFLVGQQNGINRTNAAGINFSDIWGTKMTVSGSYFFNNTNNNSFELANTQYFASNFLNSFDTTEANSSNLNHRVTMRMEYRIDSNRQLIITPNLSWQGNESQRNLSRLYNFIESSPLTRTLNQNITNSDRNGNNLNNTILYRHALAKKGRTISVNLNTSYNKRSGETFVTTFQRSEFNGNAEDTTSRRVTDQVSNSLQVSTNLVYTEPLGEKTQLQINYNPTISKSNSDQQTYAYNESDGKYSEFLQSFSNKFENRNTAHNAGMSLRIGDREKQFSIGASYQHTNLNGSQTFPATLTADKNFSNILPNAFARYTFSPRSNIRFVYRTNVNQPSVTQLQNVVDPVNAPIYTSGNPDLNQQFTHTLSSRYTFTNPTKGLLIVGNIFWQMANNYISNATFTPGSDSLISNGIVLRRGDQLNKPVNLDGYSSLRSFLTFAIPLKFIKSNININGGLTLQKLPGFINYQANETKNTTISLGSVIASNISEFVDFTVSYSANLNNVTNAIVPARNDKYFQHVASLQLNLLSKNGWFFQNELNNQYFSGLAQGFNQNYMLWNMGVGKKFLKDKKGELRLNVFDLLKQNQAITRNVTENYIEDVQYQVLQQYFILTFTYNLRNFGTAAARAANRAERNR